MKCGGTNYFLYFAQKHRVVKGKKVKSSLSIIYL